MLDFWPVINADAAYKPAVNPWVIVRHTIQPVHVSDYVRQLSPIIQYRSFISHLWQWNAAAMGLSKLHSTVLSWQCFGAVSIAKSQLKTWSLTLWGLNYLKVTCICLFNNDSIDKSPQLNQYRPMYAVKPVIILKSENKCKICQLLIMFRLVLEVIRSVLRTELTQPFQSLVQFSLSHFDLLKRTEVAQDWSAGLEKILIFLK